MDKGQENGNYRVYIGIVRDSRVCICISIYT